MELQRIRVAGVEMGPTGEECIRALYRAEKAKKQQLDAEKKYLEGFIEAAGFLKQALGQPPQTRALFEDVLQEIEEQEQKALSRLRDIAVESQRVVKRLWVLEGYIPQTER